MAELRWPRFKTDEDARCHQCDQPLVEHRRSGFAQGAGSHQGYCPQCASVTWYDLPEEVQ